MSQIQAYRIDVNGFFVEPVLISVDLPPEQIPEDIVKERPTDGLFKAKWTGDQWEEGLTQQEIDAIKNPLQPQPEPEIMGRQLVEKELQILQLQNENKVLGQSIVNLELRLSQGGL
ncbi:hypothetical protein [Brevibacillus brevis]|uniref:hypothetical protein n=1 Tax=Brevibacillus brevis TaxID=1393 RepID=UPI001157331A|nr:hypothetical protein [Lysinibacillus sp. SDF0063]TQR31987.1 hypothetical protein C7Y45_22090 [Lysinibacillus sp. SDF0063]